MTMAVWPYSVPCARGTIISRDDKRLVVTCELAVRMFESLQAVDICYLRNFLYNKKFETRLSKTKRKICAISLAKTESINNIIVA